MTHTTQEAQPKKRTLQDLKKEREERYNTLIKESLMFFAFSNEQFAANKTPLQEGEKYVSIGAGGYMPKGKVDFYLNGSKEIREWYKAAIKANKVRRQEIAYELANHESYYTGDITSAFEALGEGYTLGEVLDVYNEERKNHLND